MYPKFLFDFIMEEDYDTDSIQQDLMDCEETKEIEQGKISNIGFICNQNNDQRYILMILQFTKNHKCMSVLC